jgi:hypothetical protein
VKLTANSSTWRHCGARRCKEGGSCKVSLERSPCIKRV